MLLFRRRYLPCLIGPWRGPGLGVGNCGRVGGRGGGWNAPGFGEMAGGMNGE